MKIAKILPAQNVKTHFDYRIPDEMMLSRGDIVSVTLGNASVYGVVLETFETLETKHKLKDIVAKIEGMTLTDENLQFISKVAEYTLAPLGMVLKMMVNFKNLMKKSRGTKQKTEQNTPQEIELNAEQKTAALEIIKDLDHGFKAHLLHGITGAGKTEVYFKVVEEVLKNGGQALIMLPEIALSETFFTRFIERFGFAPHLWNSAASPATKRNIWNKMASGESGVVIGARSSLFLPFKNLKLIVVDEEHDTSYKQEEGVIYNARDMAILRAHLAKISIILSSATPSLESLINAESGKYNYLRLNSRYGAATLPEVKLIDMRATNVSSGHFLSNEAVDAIKDNIQRGEQTLIFLNRRGYAPLTICRKCGHRITCPNCSTWLIYHKNDKTLRCHHCDHTTKIPSICPVCGEADSFIGYGPGIERISEEVTELFPTAKILSLSSDNMEEEGAEALTQIENGKVDIIVGTQVLAKGHHFPNLTLVVIVDADLGLSGADLRGAEKSFQLLNQVSGRAGRADKKGLVLMQTYNPENAVIAALGNGDGERFLNLEIAARKTAEMPPYSRLAILWISGRDKFKVQKAAQALAKIMPTENGVEILGPAPAPIFMLRKNYRFHFLIKTAKNIDIQGVIRDWLARIKLPASLNIRTDIDPYSFF